MNQTKVERGSRVEALLIEPLAGLKRGRDKDGRRMTAEGHEKMLARLGSWLAYLSDEQLEGLRDHVVVIAVSGEWPSEFHIRHVAMQMCAPPIEVSPYPRSMMVSALGMRAMAEGWAFEMYQEVKLHGPPPFQEGGWKEKQLREGAEQTRRRLQIIRENIAAGIATDRERGMLAHWERDMAEIVQMQAEKRNGVAA